VPYFAKNKNINIYIFWLFNYTKSTSLAFITTRAYSITCIFYNWLIMCTKSRILNIWLRQCNDPAHSRRDGPDIFIFLKFLFFRLRYYVNTVEQGFLYSIILMYFFKLVRLKRSPSFDKLYIIHIYNTV